MTEAKNMTEGNVTKTILKFFFPMLFTNLLQQIYSVADTAVVGKGIGDNALAAVGNAVTVSLFITGFFQGLAEGFSVVISHYYGSASYEVMKKAAALSIKLCLIFVIAFTALSQIFLRKLMLLMKTDPIILDDSILYGRIIFGGLIITAAYNLCSGFLRALGDSKTPFAAIIVSSAVNILLDIIFIFRFGWGVDGAAYATIFSQLISVIICFSKLGKTKYVYFNKDDFSKNAEISGELLKNGLPMGFMNSITAIGCIAVQSYINALGADSTSAYSVCTKYLNLFMLPSLTAGFAVSAFTGQNFGAKKYDRIRKGVRTGLYIALVSYFTLGAAILIFRKQLSELMLDGETAVFYTSEYLKILGITLVLLNFVFIFRSAVQGMGKPTIPTLSGFAEMALRLFGVWFLLPKIGFIAAALADSVAWVGALSLNAAAYFFYSKKEYDKN